jgi:glutathione-independent formaldehyde dehydrogenase
MKALVYNGPRDVTVSDVEDARIESPTDVLIQVTRTNICGSDLHMYEGRTDLESGRVLGHENLGEVRSVRFTGSLGVVGVCWTNVVLAPGETNGGSAR